jgi:fluoroacetyl-CoA thioesterase
MKVTAEVELIDVSERKLRFRAICRDEADVICEGNHDRAVLDFERFMARIKKKQISAR